MSGPTDASMQENIHTPSSLNRLVRDLLEDSLSTVWIEGELSNLARPASGHMYFTLKDRSAQLRCAMFRPKSGWLKFKPSDGQQVLLQARVGFYEARGEFQLVVEHMELAGEGALRREFERLQTKLSTEGLFDTARKRLLPVWPRRVGVITSPTGAAIRDVLSIWQRRFPLLAVDVLPVPVQGREAPSVITATLTRAAQTGRYDVLLLTRGGGSLEDLACFNDETLARAIHASEVPVVAAIGHEIDFTIADFVADLRAPTPSAAAELIVPDREVLLRQLAQLRPRLLGLERRRRQSLEQRLDGQWLRLKAQRPQARLERGRERLAALYLRLLRNQLQQRQQLELRLERLDRRLAAARPNLAVQRQHLLEQQRRLQLALQQRLEQNQSRLALAARSLHSLSPLATLERGYAILLDAKRKPLRRCKDVLTSTRLTAILADGEVALQIEPIKHL